MVSLQGGLHGLIKSRFHVSLVGCKWSAILAVSLCRIERGLGVVAIQRGARRAVLVQVQGKEPGMHLCMWHISHVGDRHDRKQEGRTREVVNIKLASSSISMYTHIYGHCFPSSAGVAVTL